MPKLHELIDEDTKIFVALPEGERVEIIGYKFDLANNELKVYPPEDVFLPKED